MPITETEIIGHMRFCHCGREYDEYLEGSKSVYGYCCINEKVHVKETGKARPNLVRKRPLRTVRPTRDRVISCFDAQHPQKGQLSDYILATTRETIFLIFSR